MDRQINYPGQIAVETDLLNTNRNTMIALGKLAGALFGTGGVVNGLAVAASSPAALTVSVGPGEIYQLENVDNTAYSSLPADTTDAIVKQGISLTAQTLACAAPATAGYSINYLIQATYQDSDTGAVALPYYNASNPTQAYSGPNNNGAAQATKRAGIVVLNAKAGTAAATGSQVTPTADSGYIALAVVTVANGQTTITGANITQLAASYPKTLGMLDLASVTSGKGAALVGFQQSGTGAVARNVQAKALEIFVSPEDYGAVGDGVTDDSAAIARAIAYLASVNGGTLRFGASTYAIASNILINASNIVLEGRGADGSHDSGTGTAPCTTLKWTGSSGGTMVSFATPNSTTAAMRCQVGMKRIKLDGNQLAATGVSFTSIRGSNFEDIFVFNVTAQAFYITTYARSGMAEATDTQHCRFVRLSWRMIDTSAVQSAHGIVATSAAPGTANANTSFNYFESCGGQTYSGAGIYLIDADNNTFVSCNGYVASTGTFAYPFVIDGAYSNYFFGTSGNVRIRGTASGAWQNTTSNCFFGVDEANGTAYPTLDANCAVQWHGSVNGYQRTTTGVASIAQTAANAVAQLANIGIHSAIIHNTSQGGILQTDGTNTYSWSIDASGNYRVLGNHLNQRIDLTQGSYSVGLKMAQVGFQGTNPIAAPTPSGVTAGFTAGTGTTVVSGSTFTGNTGTTAYTIGDIVSVLKQYGLFKA